MPSAKCSPTNEWRSAGPHSLRIAFFLSLSLNGCFGSPTPLAPGLRGSVGLPHYGVQTEARELPKSSPGLARFRPRGENHWAQPRLVEALVRIAAELDRQYGTSPPMVVGDLSARWGGKIPRHNSHRSGRDVDLLWFFTTPHGIPVSTPGFIHVGPDGLAPLYNAGSYLMLDVPKQWALFKALLEEPELGVQFMFVSENIEALLIEYARSKGEPTELVYRAATVMLEPGDSAPHDDHLHLRVACTPQEMLEGCLGGGPYWPWLAQPSALIFDDDLAAEIAQSDPIDPDLFDDGPSVAEPVVHHLPAVTPDAQHGVLGGS